MEYIEEKRDPKQSLMYDAHWRECICETLRSIYDDLHDYPDKELKKKITKKLVQGMRMVKNVSARLTYYQETYQDNTGSRGSRLRLIPEYPANKARRRARLKKKK